jgi:hypothetical protein
MIFIINVQYTLITKMSANLMNSMGFAENLFQMIVFILKDLRGKYEISSNRYMVDYISSVRHANFLASKNKCILRLFHRFG